jgi:Zn-dependent protease
MRTVAPEAIGLGTIFGVSLIGPWETDSSFGGWGFPTAFAVLLMTCVVAGRRHGWAESLLSGAAVGFLGIWLYVTGSALAYELGWYGRSWDDFGEYDWTFLGIILFSAMLYGPPFAAIGAVFAGIGHILAGFRRHPVAH